MPILYTNQNMKKLLFGAIYTLVSITAWTHGQWRWDYGDTPMQVLDRIVDDANDEYNIQDTPLEAVNEWWWQFNAEYKIANTLDSIRYNIAKYIQRVIFIGMALAVIGIIITGLLMVTKSISGEEFEKIKSRIIGIVVGVLILGWFLAIIRLVLSLITSVVGTSGGDTGF